MRARSSLPTLLAVSVLLAPAWVDADAKEHSSASMSVKPPVTVAGASAGLAVGTLAPDFVLPCTSGKKLQLKSLRGKVVVLYFYPKDETPGCTRETCDFRDRHGALDSAGVVLLGVSRDDLDSHHKFIAKERLPFPLLADVDGRACRAYGVMREREKDGQTVRYVERTTFVIGKDGRIARVWSKVDVNGHVEDVLAFVRGS